MVQPLYRTVWWFLTKLSTFSCYGNPSRSLVFTKGTENPCPHKNLYLSAHSNTIHSCQSLEGTKMFSSS